MQLQSDYSNLKYMVSELNKTLTQALKDNTVLKLDNTNLESKINICQNKTNKIELKHDASNHQTNTALIFYYLNVGNKIDLRAETYFYVLCCNFSFFFHIMQIL